jgi:hypothetical protein
VHIYTGTCKPELVDDDLLRVERVRFEGTKHVCVQVQVGPCGRFHGREARDYLTILSHAFVYKKFFPSFFSSSFRPAFSLRLLVA